MLISNMGDKRSALPWLCQASNCSSWVWEQEEMKRATYVSWDHFNDKWAVVIVLGRKLSRECWGVHDVWVPTYQVSSDSTVKLVISNYWSMQLTCTTLNLFLNLSPCPTPALICCYHRCCVCLHNSLWLPRTWARSTFSILHRVDGYQL